MLHAKSQEINIILDAFIEKCTNENRQGIGCDMGIKTRANIDTMGKTAQHDYYGS